MPDPGPDPAAVARGQRFRAARKRAGLTQQVAADRIGVSKQSVSDWERGGNVSDANLDRAAAVYGESPAALRYGTESGADVTAERLLPMEAERPLPRVARSYAVRVWLKEFELELVRAGVPDERVAEAIDALTAPQLLHYFVGGRERELTEEEAVQLMNGMADVIRHDLLQRGFRLPDAS